MPENEEYKNLTIRDVSTVNIDKFHAIRAEKGFTPGKMFDVLLNEEKNPETSVNTDSLQKTINELTERLQVFEAENQRLQSENNQLKESLQEESGKTGHVTENLSTLKTELEQAQARISELETESAGKVQINYPDFICKLPEHIALAIAQNRDRFYRANFTENKKAEDYPNEFSKYAIRYLLLNEFQRKV